jgi:hypothetical protein
MFFSFATWIRKREIGKNFNFGWEGTERGNDPFIKGVKWEIFEG